jgi:DNA (cytosine-5)-methyltransferase 1
MRMLDLFSGIGGFSLAAQWVWGDELDIVGFCEIDEYCHKVLEKNFPNVPIHNDIKELNGNDIKDIDLITGGFPCTDISLAGRGKGLIDEDTGETTRSGLWFEMHRIISEVRPNYALIENVPALTFRGGARVIADLAEIGYDAEWTIIGADDVGAWHRRKRIWIVAYPNGTGGKPELREKIPRQEGEKIPDTELSSRGAGGDTLFSEFKNERSSTDTSAWRLQSTQPKNIELDKEAQGKRCEQTDTITGSCEDVPNPKSKRHRGRNSEECGTQGRELLKEEQGRSTVGGKAKGCSGSYTDVSNTNNNGSGSQGYHIDEQGEAETQGSELKISGSRSESGRYSEDREGKLESNMGQLAYGLPPELVGYWNREPEDVPRVGVGIKNRVSKLKALGNAIVPQVAYIILKRIKECG